MPDSLFIPVIITDENGKVTYKNIAAKRCIPSPRKGGNLLKYTDGTPPLPSGSDISIITVINSTSVFNRAFVVEYENENYWIFSPELALAEPENITRILSSKLETLSVHIKKLIESIKAERADFSATRFFRMEEELLFALKKISLRHSYGAFKANDVIFAIYEETLRISSALNFRVRISVENKASENNKLLRFIPLALTYIYSLLFFLNISKKAECSVKILYLNDRIDLLLSTPLTLPENRICKSLEDIAELLPKDQLNLMLLLQSSSINELNIFFNIDHDGILTLRLSPPIEEADDMFLFQPVVSAQKEELTRIKEHIARCVNNMLNIK